LIQVHRPSKEAELLPQSLNQVGWVTEVLKAYEVLFDRPCRDKPIENTDASSFIVRSTCTRSTERLLTHDCASAFLVVVYVTSGVTQLVGCVNKSGTVLSEARRYVRRIGTSTITMKTYMDPVRP